MNLNRVCVYLISRNGVINFIMERLIVASKRFIFAAFFLSVFTESKSSGSISIIKEKRNKQNNQESLLCNTFWYDETRKMRLRHMIRDSHNMFIMYKAHK